MTHILHLDASPRGERSHSRRMTRTFVEHLAESIAAAQTQVAQLIVA